MKVIASLLVVFAFAASGVGRAQAPDSPYVTSLSQMSALCTVIATGIGAKEGTARNLAEAGMIGAGEAEQYAGVDAASARNAMTPGTAKINSCLSDAAKKGMNDFKQYSNGESQQIKQDMKAVLVAWIPYMRASTVQARASFGGQGDANSFAIAKEAYDKAVATLQVDRLTN